MKRHSRKAMELSFNMIVSVIVIAVIIAVAFYAIRHFLALKSCAEIGLYGRSLQERVDELWNSDSGNESYEGIVPSSVDEVCFGNLSITAARNAPEYTELKVYRDRDANVFYYPIPSCEIRSFKLNHARVEGFKCVPVRGGRALVQLSKGSFDSDVRIRA